MAKDSVSALGIKVKVGSGLPEGWEYADDAASRFGVVEAWIRTLARKEKINSKRFPGERKIAVESASVDHYFATHPRREKSAPKTYASLLISSRDNVRAQYNALAGNFQLTEGVIFVAVEALKTALEALDQIDDNTLQAESLQQELPKR